MGRGRRTGWAEEGHTHPYTHTERERERGRKEGKRNRLAIHLHLACHVLGQSVLQDDQHKEHLQAVWVDTQVFHEAGKCVHVCVRERECVRARACVRACVGA